MTTMPSMSIEARTGRIASTAAWSTRSLSPRPMKRPAAIAAASVTRTSSSARLRSGSGGRSPASPITASLYLGRKLPARVRAAPRGVGIARRGPGGASVAGPSRPSPSRASVEPVERPGDGLLPVLEVLVALRGVHLRLPALVLGPVVADVVLAGPEPGRQTGRVGGAERRGLGHRGPDDRHAEDVGLELHEQVVADHAAIDLQRLELDARVLVHRLDDLAALVGRGLQRRAGDVPGVDVTGQAGEHAARV